MARKKTAKRKSKEKKYCFIVEGCTEENYIKLLKELYRHPQVDKPQNCHGGNAKGVLMKAERLISKYGNDYLGYIIWFDNDKYFPSQDANLKNSLEAKPYCEIYMSDPCVEHWLLAHFQPINLSQNRSCDFYEQLLKKYIQDYDKNDCVLLKKHINKENIEIAVTHYPEIGELPRKYFIKA
ncbi:hypothetical protein THIOM_004294 [Candidatus Thiomargarita nelsonii]|uniref:Abortive phage resistance protein n=1 Tax=Candidatus Thiomargarita nelsonii TaxID=1003181 RepID=A0A0A6NX90_9GAMM|nr:hypothetical protein THIOM_004294 [Candidatus Thiomargarita nelsonii]